MSKFETVFDAVKEGTLEDVKYFIEQKGVGVNTKDRTDHTLIQHAFVIGKDNPEVGDIIEYLMLKGANIEEHQILDAVTMENERDSIKITNLFIKRGVSVNHRDSGMFPLLLAAGFNNVEVAKFLISKGANIKMASSVTGLTPLQLAKEKGNTEMVEYLKSVRWKGKSAVVIVIGAVLMFVLMRFVQIKVGYHTIDFGIAILAAFAAAFGPVVGFLIGFIGCALTNFLWHALWWSGIISSAIFGGVIGWFWKSFKIEKGGFGLKQCITFNGIQVVTNILVWVFIAQILDMIFYGTVMWGGFRRVFTARTFGMIFYNAPFRVNLYEFTAAVIDSAVVLVFGSLLCFGYSKYKSKH